MTKAFRPEDSSRTSLRRAQRERAKAYERKFVEEFKIPKGLVQHAHRYGSRPSEIIRTAMQNNALFAKACMDKVRSLL